MRHTAKTQTMPMAPATQSNHLHQPNATGRNRPASQARTNNRIVDAIALASTYSKHEKIHSGKSKFTPENSKCCRETSMREQKRNQMFQNRRGSDRSELPNTYREGIDIFSLERIGIVATHESEKERRGTCESL